MRGTQRKDRLQFVFFERAMTKKYSRNVTNSLKGKKQYNIEKFREIDMFQYHWGTRIFS